ncbi:GNAT family N-acetyltransferase [Akkermansiaceae bacterium]|nr:GNAT family N-acetyltransferase [Akkermansiaceae bacterium]MDA7888198.1 GNAT family N-acetyltransferase [Akkermansiaceae bacterium]
MPDQLIIRPAEAGDIAILVDFNIRMAWETEERNLELETLTSGVRAILEDAARGFYLVAEMAGKVVGSLMVTTEWSDWRNGDFWWVQSVYVQPESRNQGVFKALYEETRNRAVSTTGVCGCRLYVEKDNAGAQAVYLRLGLKETDYRLYEDSFS